MSISFKATPKINPQNPTAAQKFYARVLHKDQLNIDELSVIIADKTTASRADTYAVIISLLEQVMPDLAARRLVVLGKLAKLSTGVEQKDTYLQANRCCISLHSFRMNCVKKQVTRE